MQWINTSKVFNGTQPETNSFIIVLNGFTLQIKRDFHQGSWTLTGWGNGVHIEPTNLLTKDPIEAQKKAFSSLQKLLKDKVNFLVKLMSEVHMLTIAKIKENNGKKESQKSETKTH